MAHKTYVIGVGMTSSTSPDQGRRLPGQADKRQVDHVDVALQHTIGLGGAAVVSIYRRAT